MEMWKFSKLKDGEQHSFLVQLCVTMHLSCAYPILSKCGALYRLFQFRSFHNLHFDRRIQLHTFCLRILTTAQELCEERQNKQNHIAMKRLLILFLLLAVGSTDLYAQNDNSQIYYTSSDGLIVMPYEEGVAIFGANIVSNSYENSIGTIVFDRYVTSIGDEAFRGCKGLTSIIIPNGVTEIGDVAFYGCDNLTSITIPNSVTSIGNSAFADCTNLTSITIPNGVTEIGDWAFNGCGNLKRFYGKFATPDGKALICNGKLISYAHGNYAESYNIPNSVTEIGVGVFSGCTNLTSITIPNSVTSIGDNAFSNCDNLKSITIPNSVISIGDVAFSDCDNLTSITIPNSVTSIGSYAFEGCTNLTSIVIPNSVASIEGWAFCGCKNLTSIIIPNSVTKIGEGAFLGCTNLTSITIPNSVRQIGDNAFYYCENLKEVYCKATTPPSLLYRPFDANASGRKIYVPRESVEAYKSADGWSLYASDIVGYDF